MVYVAFVIDVFSRQIVGWRAATRMTTDLVLDALEQALWSRKQQGITSFTGLVHHTDAGSQYVSFALTQRLVEAGVDPSVGSNRLFKVRGEGERRVAGVERPVVLL